MINIPYPPQPLLVVVALYDCDPDQKDELGFKEGQRIVVTAKTSKEWWVSMASLSDSLDRTLVCTVLIY